jgi:transcription antitermination factor NusG
MLALAKNPPMLWPGETVLTDARLAWTAAYCKPRQEKALAHELCRRQVPYFLPMVLRETISGGRRRRNLYPLFPSYLFFSGDEQQRLAILKTDRIVRLIDVSDAEQPRFRQEMQYLQAAVQHAPESIELYPRLVSGAPVRVTAGVLKNVEGIIIQSQNKRKLWLGVSILGVGVTLEIHADFVAPID